MSEKSAGKETHFFKLNRFEANVFNSLQLQIRSFSFILKEEGKFQGIHTAL
jgi:hypothetical protein